MVDMKNMLGGQFYFFTARRVRSGREIATHTGHFAGAGARMRKDSDQEVKARQEKFPLRDFLRGGNVN
jgi:hypothetical protein